MTTAARVALLGFLVAVVIAMWVFAFLSKHFEKVASGVAMLEPADFERLTLVTLGSGGTFENQWRRGPALAVGLADEVVLVDAGRGVAEALRAAVIPVEQPRVLLLTNLDAENVLGLDDLGVPAVAIMSNKITDEQVTKVERFAKSLPVYKVTLPLARSGSTMSVV